jgi:hypothetical protein
MKGRFICFVLCNKNHKINNINVGCNVAVDKFMAIVGPDSRRRHEACTIIEVLTAVKMSLFWAATMCGFVGRYQRFGEKYCLHLLKMETVCFIETLLSTCECTRSHDPEEQHRQVASCSKTNCLVSFDVLVALVFATVYTGVINCSKIKLTKAQLSTHVSLNTA